MKPVPAIEYPIHELLLKRYSPYIFSSRKLDISTIQSLFEAIRWAPSCFNEQPWAYIVIRPDQRDQYAAFIEAMPEQDRAWATTAPLLILSVAKVSFSANGKPNPYAWHDICLATGALIVQGMSMGVYAHQMAAFSKERIRSVCEIPAEWDPVTMIALGYIGDNPSVPEQYAMKDSLPQIRKKISEFVFDGTWGKKIDG